MTRKFSEYVSPGHPDKCADYISEYILDRYLEKDPKARYAVEVMIKGDEVYIAGEVTAKAFFGYNDICQFVKNALIEIGYTKEYYDAWNGQVINPDDIVVTTNITAQSPEIGQGVDNDGWGDQGIFFGYADPDEEYMTPRSHSLAKDLCHLFPAEGPPLQPGTGHGCGGVRIGTGGSGPAGRLLRQEFLPVLCHPYPRPGEGARYLLRGAVRVLRQEIPRG